MALEIHPVPVTAFQQNCSVVFCSETQTAVAIDPGGDLELIQEKLDELDATLVDIWLTHGHFDHAGASRLFAEQKKVSITGPEQADLFWLDRIESQAQSYGLPPYSPFQPDQWLKDGDTLQLGQWSFQVIHCPGHTPGHVVFYQAESKNIIVGDVLFAGSIGRTDFPMSVHQDLIDSIKEKLFKLPDDVTVYPGHGPTTTLGREKKSNPYVGENARGF